MKHKINKDCILILINKDEKKKCKYGMKFVEWFLFLELILWFYVNWLLQLQGCHSTFWYGTRVPWHWEFYRHFEGNWEKINIDSMSISHVYIYIFCIILILLFILLMIMTLVLNKIVFHELKTMHQTLH